MIGIVVAMKQEILNYLNNFNKVENKYFELYQKDNIILIISSVGKVNASIATSYLINNYDIEYIINIGIAGGNTDANINDIYLIDKLYYHDFDLTVFNYELGEVPHLFKYLETNKKLYKNLLNKYPLKNCASGDVFLTKKPKVDVSCFDMESCSIAHTCFVYKKDFISIKVISDCLGKDQIKDYLTFEKNASIKITSILEEVLK